MRKITIIVENPTVTVGVISENEKPVDFEIQLKATITPKQYEELYNSAEKMIKRLVEADS
ncbi:MAG: hypothetical protein AB7D46_00640 [Flavobacteriaceae bacterium]